MLRKLAKRFINIVHLPSVLFDIAAETWIYIHSLLLHFPPLTRCETAWRPSVHWECAWAGWKSPAGVHTVHVLPPSWTLCSPAAVFVWVTLSQHARWRLPVLQTPECWGTLQQPAHWDAPCQAQLDMKTQRLLWWSTLIYGSIKLWCMSKTMRLSWVFPFLREPNQYIYC